MTKEFIAKVCLAVKACGAVPKDGHNDHSNYDYATIQAIARNARRALADNGLALLPGKITHREDVETKTSQGKTAWICRITREYELTDGESHYTFEVCGDGADTGDKAVYKALTGCRKYAANDALFLEIGDDAEKDSHDVTKTADKAEPGNGKAYHDEDGVRGPACPKCGGPMKLVPGGVSKKSNKEYGPFWGCKNRNCKGTMKADAWEESLAVIMAGERAAAQGEGGMPY